MRYLCRVKKALLILLICAYAISTFGVSIKEFHCCGQIKYVGISYIAAHFDNRKDCCETTHHFYKITDSHLVAKHITKSVKPFTDQTPPAHPLATILPISRLSGYANTTNAPPVAYKTPIYTLHCVYRI